jgi:heparin/heparan-sulfate lyase
MNLKNRFFVVLSIILSAELSAQQRPEVKWTLIDSISVPVPPAEHPRLFLTSRDVPDLKKRVSHPGLKQVWEELQEQAGKNVQIQIEVDAAKFLMTGDRELGLRTLDLALKTLEKAEYDLTVQDVTRPIGRMMVTGAIAYDWCYPLLTALQKKAFQDQLFRLAEQLECGYPPKHGWVTGHGSEWMVMRDMLSAGIAIYDEIPEMYQHAAKTFFAFLLPERNFWYPGHAFHQGTAYAETRFVSDLYPLWIFDRMGFGNVYDPA